jgi:uncharacterized protein
MRLITIPRQSTAVVASQRAQKCSVWSTGLVCALLMLAASFPPAVRALPQSEAAPAQTQPPAQQPTQPAPSASSQSQASSQGQAEGLTKVRASGYVIDTANVLSPAATSRLTALCTELDHKAQAQIAVVTVKSLGDKPIEEASIDLATHLGVGPKGSDRGLLILVAIDDHKDRIEVGYGLEGILPDGKTGGILRYAVPLLRQQDYDGAVTLMVQSVANAIATDRGITLSTTAMGSSRPRPQPGRPSAPHITFGEIIGIVFVLFWVFGLLGRMFGGPGGRRGGMGGVGNFGAGWIIGNMLGGGFRGGWGGGGFGGGGGGGGFGGFGGGSFGGGGASGSW